MAPPFPARAKSALSAMPTASGRRAPILRKPPVSPARRASTPWLVSVGNVHLQQNQASTLDEVALAAIEAVTEIPLVIHGGSGVPQEQRRHLAKTSSICKFNIGTELRQIFGQAVRKTLNTDPDLFDRVGILKATEPEIEKMACAIIQALGASGRAPT